LHRLQPKLADFVSRHPFNANGLILRLAGDFRGPSQVAG
jgi:hypothetical protein